MKMDFCPNCFQSTGADICPYCNFNISQMAYTYVELKPGTVVADRYKIGRVLGIGGFGITYVGYDLQSKKRYAVKEYMPKDVAIRKENGTVEPNSTRVKDIYNKGLDMFLYETNILITLSGNKGIVEAENFVLANNTGYLVMEYLDGVSVKKLLNSRQVLDPDLSINILTEVAQALAAVHGKGLLHRDISPENIMVMKDGTVKLIDFGASRFFVGERSKSLSLILKHGFAPPEQYSSTSNQGEWTDIYALAATYYKMVTGITIPDALTRSTVDTVERLDKLNPAVKPYVGRAIRKALALRIRDRYQDVNEFIRALRFDDQIQANNVPENFSVQITEPPKPQQGFFKRLWKSFTSVPQGNTVNGGSYEYSDNQPTDRGEDFGYQEPEPMVSPYVRVVNGAYTLGKWTLMPDEQNFVGRDSSMCNIQVLDSSISRRHCMIRYSSSSDSFIIVDYSANGTFFFNGTRLQRDVEYTLNKGDCVMLASQDYILEVGLQ